MASDRDLAVAVARALKPDLAGGSVWEMTAATGVRGLRLWAEAGGFRRMLLTDAHPAAVKVLSANASALRASGLEVRRWDAQGAPEERAFDWVDLDPYGSPIPFVAAAITALAEGGILAVTATDLKVLAGAERGAAERRYGGRPLRGHFGPEAGLRILLAYLVGMGDRARRTLRPFLAYVGGHYLRAYLRDGSTVPSSVGVLDPTTWTGPRVPGSRPYGPMWLGPLLDGGLLATMAVPVGAARPSEVSALLSGLRLDARVDAPFFYESNELARALGLDRPPPVEPLLDSLRALGFPSERTYARRGAFRTRAPRGIVEEVARHSPSVPRRPA